MELVRADNSDHLAWTYSDANEYFTFDPVTNPRATGMKVKVFSARFITGNIGYGACVYPACIDNAASNSSNKTDFYTRQTSMFSVGDGSQNIGTDYKGELDGGNAVFATEVYSVASDVTYYVGVCFDDVYGFYGNNGNNCTVGVAVNVTSSDIIFEDGFE